MLCLYKQMLLIGLRLKIVLKGIAPISRDLAGIILPHNRFGAHQISQGITEEIELEQRNFAYVGSKLAKVWSNTVIHGHPTVAEYIGPEMSNIFEKEQEWYATHVKEPILPANC